MAPAIWVSSKGIPIHNCSQDVPVTSPDTDSDLRSIATAKSGTSWLSRSSSKRRSLFSFRTDSSLSDMSDSNYANQTNNAPNDALPQRASTNKGWNRRSVIAGVMSPSHWGDRDYMKCVTFSKTKDHMRWTPLHYAAKKGFAAAAKLLIEDGIPLEAKTIENQTALHMACAEGHLDVVETLLQHEANYWATDSEIRTPVALATEKKNLDVCVLLFKVDKDKTHFAEEKSQLLTSAIFTGDKAQLRSLLASHCDPNATVGGPRPLRLAVEKGDAEVVSILLKSGADPSLRAADGSLPLATAVLRRSTEIVRLLIAHGASAFAPSAHGKSPFKIALERGDNDVVRLLMEKNPKQIFTSGEAHHKLSMLSMAIDCDNIEAVRQLLETGSDPSSREEDGSTPLIRAAFPERLDIMDLILQQGAVVDEPDLKGILPIQSVVFRAARRMQTLRSSNSDLQATLEYENSTIDTLSTLMQYGADLHSADANGKNILHLAAEVGFKRIALFCLSNRFNVNVEDCNGWAPLHWAAFGGDQSTTQALMLRGADVDLSDDNGLTPLLIACKYSNNDVAFLLSSDCDLNHRDSQGHSALYYAAIGENLPLAEHLLSKGAIAFERDYNPPSPPGTPSKLESPATGGALFVCAARASEICKLGATYELRQSLRPPSPTNLKRLLSLGAPPNTNVGDTPLVCLAATAASADLIMILINAKADITATDRNGQTALHTAASCGNSDTVCELLAAGADANAKDVQGRMPEDVANKAGHVEIAYNLITVRQHSQRAISVKIRRPNLRLISDDPAERKALEDFGTRLATPTARGNSPSPTGLPQSSPQKSTASNQSGSKRRLAMLMQQHHERRRVAGIAGDLLTNGPSSIIGNPNVDRRNGLADAFTRR